jgi:hypothetical protein
LQIEAAELAHTQPGTYEVEVNPATSFAAILGSRKETRHYHLALDEKQLVGNPSNSPVEVGDPVIKPADLPRFIASLKPKAATLAPSLEAQLSF